MLRHWSTLPRYTSISPSLGNFRWKQGIFPKEKPLPGVKASHRISWVCWWLHVNHKSLKFWSVSTSKISRRQTLSPTQDLDPYILGNWSLLGLDRNTKSHVELLFLSRAVGHLYHQNIRQVSWHPSIRSHNQGTQSKCLSL